ncbi:hypothetical protein B2G71_05540 [Novosphingobium sp. PC22D]|uniref:TetR/AcrR family transcriptional regulator n=1 Tax=Novosphingobium sp. PC22D TaxID=1962403 RepID=UPI000BEF1CDD|nr:TetR/AcrR family transcriptional regulator [Novosphingobium sp. PC22D]PEQ13776.1 hypothetical protein B2G71_05540 [Novosphingobium sp. PC22D]
MRADALRHRQALIEAAAKVFGEQGYDVPLATILREARLGRGTLYRHFATREDLIIAAISHDIEVLRRKVEQCEDRPDLFLALIEDQSRSVAAHLRVLSTFQDERLQDFAIRVVPTYDGVLETVLNSAKRHGLVRETFEVEDLVLLITMLSTIRSRDTLRSSEAIARSKGDHEADEDGTRRYERALAILRDGFAPRRDNRT